MEVCFFSFFFFFFSFLSFFLFFFFSVPNPSPFPRDKPESEEVQSEEALGGLAETSAETSGENGNGEMREESEGEYTEEDDDSFVDEDLPSAEIQKQKFTDLANESEMKEGDPWYLVHSRWWSQWKGYTGVRYR